MSTPLTPQSSETLRYLRFGITVAAWLTGLALLVQVTTWTLVNYTDMRQSELKANTVALVPIVVTHGPRRAAANPVVGTLGSVTLAGEDAGQVQSEPPDLNLVMTGHDVRFRILHNLARGAGLIGIIILVVQLSMAVSVGAGSGMVGVGRIVVAQTWAVVLLSLALPWQRFLTDFPFQGLFTDYSSMVRASEQAMQGLEPFWESAAFHGRYLLMPGAGMLAVMFIGLGYRGALEGKLLERPRRVPFLDPKLEAEASQRAAGSLVGFGRAGGALQVLTQAQATVAPETPATIGTASAASDPPSPPASPTAEPASRRPI